MTNLRRLVRVIAGPLVLALTLTIPAQAAHAGGRAQRFQNEMLRLVNQTRSAHSLQTVRLNGHLSREAWRHSVAMGRRYVLFHTTNLWDLVRPYDAHRDFEPSGDLQASRAMLYPVVRPRRGSGAVSNSRNVPCVTLAVLLCPFS